MKAVIDAAMALFSEKGFAATSIKEIAARAHVSQVSIYNYFGSKEALVAECAHIVMVDTFRKAGELLEKDIPFIEKIKLALQLCTENINLSISACFTEHALRDAAFARLLTESINEEKRGIYREFIESGKQAGAIDSAIPTATILEFTDALGTIDYPLASSSDLAEKLAHAHHLFLYGLIGKA